MSIIISLALHLLRQRQCYLCVQHGRVFVLQFFFLFSFLLTLGPTLPKKLYGFSTVEIHGDAFIFGGYEHGVGYNSVIYRFTCSSGICRWSILNQALKVAREWTVAIPVPDTLCVQQSCNKSKTCVKIELQICFPTYHYHTCVTYS